MGSLLVFVSLVLAMFVGVVLFARFIGAGRAALSLYLEELGLSRATGWGVLVVVLGGIGASWMGADALDYGFGLASTFHAVGVVLVGVALTQLPMYRAATGTGGTLVDGSVSDAEGETHTPYTGTGCVVYDAREQRPISGVYTGTTAPLVATRSTAGVPFSVEGQTDRVRVESLDPARIELAVDDTGDLSSEDTDGSSSERFYEERRLQPGNTVTVVAVDGETRLLTEHATDTVEKRLVADVKRNGLLGAVFLVIGAGWLAAYGGLI